MWITVQIPAPLRETIGGVSHLTVSADSVRDVLEQLDRMHPDLYRSVCNETGAVRQHINVFVNSDYVRDLDGLDTMLQSGDVVSLLTAVSGG